MPVNTACPVLLLMGTCNVVVLLQLASLFRVIPNLHPPCHLRPESMADADGSDKVPWLSIGALPDMMRAGKWGAGCHSTRGASLARCTVRMLRVQAISTSKTPGLLIAQSSQDH